MPARDRTPATVARTAAFVAILVAWLIMVVGLRWAATWLRDNQGGTQTAHRGAVNPTPYLPSG